MDLLIIIDKCKIFSLIIAKALLHCLFSILHRFLYKLKIFIHRLDSAIWLCYIVHYLQFFLLQPGIEGTWVAYRWIGPDPVDIFCLYLTSLFHNRPNTITKIISSSRYNHGSYGYQRLTDPPLFHSVGEDTPILYMYAEVTHCRINVTC